MGRYTGPKNKISRRFGVNLGLKTNAAKVARRLNLMPGVHGPNKRVRATSSFGKQLMEKQKAKFTFGLRESQLRRYVKEAGRITGDSSVTLMRILEKRLDNVVYRMGFAVTRAQARQLVNHGMFTVNGRKIDIPSHIVKLGDTIALKENKQKKKFFETIEEKLSQVNLPSWLSVDPAKKSGRILNQPGANDFEKVFDAKMIIEYFATR
jgi:small subunit ribosomal protein S4